MISNTHHLPLATSALCLITIAAILPSHLSAAESTSQPSMNVMAENREGPRYIRIDEFDFLKLLPPPPAAGSIEEAADLDTVLQVQATRTEEQTKWAKQMERDEIFLNRDVLGDWFDAAQLPETAAFFRTLSNDLRAMDGASKLPFRRKRPYETDPRVTPCVSLPTSSSYPSGSALQALVWAELLAELVPQKREALTARAYRAAWGRVIGGVHFPTDIEAGRRLAPPFLKACRNNPEFVRRFESVRQEFGRLTTK